MTFTLVHPLPSAAKLLLGIQRKRGDVSKASRLFRFRANRETTLSALLPAIPPPSTSIDAALARLREAAEADAAEPCADLLTADTQSSALAEMWAPTSPLPPSVIEMDAVDMSDPLAILQQTIEPAAQLKHVSHAKRSIVASISQRFDAGSESVDTDDATLIGAKVHCEVNVSGSFLTETMDLEAIAACAREANAELSGMPASIAAADAGTSDAVQQEIVAEVSAVAEEFVAEQQHHIEPQAARIVTPTDLSAPDQSVDGAPANAAERPRDRRRKRRALISAPIRVRGATASGNGLDEIATTVDVSRTGILFHSGLDAYSRDMELAVVFPYSQAPCAVHTEQMGRVVRVNDLGNGIYAVAIALRSNTCEDQTVADTSAPTVDPLRDSTSAPKETKKPMVLAVDADETLRDALKLYLQNEGYDVIAVNNAADAREVLNIFTPALVIAEVEGEGTPGYDLCAYVKSSTSLRRVPVVLTTSSAYPSDYSNAHSLGAIVCMAKPYKQERLGHIVRLLAPLPEHLQNTVAPHAADPTRVPGRDGNFGSRALRLVRGNSSTKKSNPHVNSSKIRFRFPSFR